MSAVKDGGAAFPCLELDRVTGQVVEQHLGVSMRDYFAARALSGYLSDPTWREDIDMDRTARFAYCMADAMLRAREAQS